jgi:hypothetical protein
MRFSPPAGDNLAAGAGRRTKCATEGKLHPDKIHGEGIQKPLLAAG